METKATVVLDSKNTNCGTRLTTFQVTFPRFILAEVNTHRVLSRNTASSRAIPVAKMVETVRTTPVVPFFGQNQRGMQDAGPLPVDVQHEAEQLWREAATVAASYAERLAALGVHKQVANRVLEPFNWVTSVLTATDWDNFFTLRTHPDAQPEFRVLATAMQAALAASIPRPVAPGEWHRPFLTDDEAVGLGWEEATAVSVARCARVSYTQFPVTFSPADDLDLCRRLRESGHWSPFEHVAQARLSAFPSGNFSRGWLQYRKLFPGESGCAQTETAECTQSVLR